MEETGGGRGCELGRFERKLGWRGIFLRGTLTGERDVWGEGNVEKGLTGGGGCGKMVMICVRRRIKGGEVVCFYEEGGF